MKKYPHGLTLNAVCAAIDDYERYSESVPEEGILAAFNTLLGHSDIANELRIKQNHIRLRDTYIEELEQRAEAAEAKYSEVSDWYAKMKTRMLAAEAKLAELEGQEPVAWRYRTTNIHGEPNPNWSFSDSDSLMGLYQPLYAKPASAINLVELVPDEKSILAEAGGYGSLMSLEQKNLFVEGGKWVRAAILRNIDESGIAASLAHIGFDPSGGDEATVIVHHVAPAGWKLVPAEPSWEMISAAIKHHEGDAFLPVSLYKTMLTAAPTPPE